MVDMSGAKKTRYRGVFKMPSGSHLVRHRLIDPVTGKQIQIKKVLDVPAAEAHGWLMSEIDRIKSGKALPPKAQQRFSVFAEALLNEKVAKGEIRSGKGREKWKYGLIHLIQGTTSESGVHVPGFGDMFVDMIHRSHIDQWQLGIAEFIATKEYSPVTANTWLSILRVVMREAKRKFELPGCATEDIPSFSTKDHVTYTEEEPNALDPKQVPLFMSELRARWPQHYAMTFIGLATGLRPSTLRPLRRKGDSIDVLFDESKLLIRQSETKGKVMQATKTGTRYSVPLPPEAIEVLKWHIDTQLSTPEMQKSDLLFPAVDGGFRSPGVLNAPFEDVCTTLGLPKLTQSGMRRTFQDLARAAQVQDIVTRSISGHATEEMQEHYSTVAADERMQALGKVIQLFAPRAASNT